MKILITGGTGLVGYGIRKVIEKRLQHEKDGKKNTRVVHQYIIKTTASLIQTTKKHRNKKYLFK